MRNIVSPLDGIRSPFGNVSALSIYAVAGFEPPVVADFEAEYYRTGGSPTTFDSMFTHSASTNATMVDSDGLLKWRPHNLLTYSEDFSNAAWGKANVSVSANSVTGPDGETTADTLTQSVVSATVVHMAQTHTIIAGAQYTYSIYLKQNDCADYIKVLLGSSNQSEGFGLSIDPSDMSIQYATATGTGYSYVSSSVTSIGSGWYKVSVTGSSSSVTSVSSYVGFNDSATGNFATDRITNGGTGSVFIWGAHVYRSDLGGMVNNPDRGDSYVPTTSSAVYLPRRGNHVYNGTSWVNEGLLIESEARTNLVTYSEDFTNAAWSKNNVTYTATAATSDPSGNNGAYIFDPSASPTNAYSIFTSSATSGTLSVFFKEGTERYAMIIRGAYTAKDYAIFDLQSGSVTQNPDAINSTAGMVDCGNGWWRCWLNSGQTSTGINAFSVSGGPTGTGTASSGYVYIWGAQFEEGSTPSSYIPTSGATVTRAAETLTIPSAQLPWPSPVVIGPELVAGGEFNDAGDLAEWTLAGGTAAVDASGVTLTNTSTRTTLSETLSVATGKVYRLTGTLNNLTSGPNAARIRITSTNSYSGTLVVEFASAASGDVGFEIFFVAPASTLYIWAANNTTTAGNLVRFDNISVKEIDPLAVSIQMDGTMTYADANNTREVNQIRWVANANNGIEFFYDTGTLISGQVFFQENGGVTDNVSTVGNYYTPGIDVPFNIASRHGSTFINGAVDGTALTADTTPVALPDLSATNLQLGYDYMGTIGQFRVWAKDLGDAGIEEASTNA